MEEHMADHEDATTIQIRFTKRELEIIEAALPIEMPDNLRQRPGIHPLVELADLRVKVSEMINHLNDEAFAVARARWSTQEKPEANLWPSTSSYA